MLLLEKLWEGVNFWGNASGFNQNILCFGAICRFLLFWSKLDAFLEKYLISQFSLLSSLILVLHGHEGTAEMWLFQALFFLRKFLNASLTDHPPPSLLNTAEKTPNLTKTPFCFYISTVLSLHAERRLLCFLLCASGGWWGALIQKELLLPVGSSRAGDCGHWTSPVSWFMRRKSLHVLGPCVALGHGLCLFPVPPSLVRALLCAAELHILVGWRLFRGSHFFLSSAFFYTGLWSRLCPLVAIRAKKTSRSFAHHLRLNPEPFLPFCHDQDPNATMPFTARGPACRPLQRHWFVCLCYPVTHPSVL